MTGLNAGTSTCPVCDRTWLVTPLDDCLIPQCEHYAGMSTGAENPSRPCHKCGLTHALACVKRRAG